MVNQKNTLRSVAEKKRDAGQKTAKKQWKFIPKDPSEQEKFDMALRFQNHLNKSSKESNEKVDLMKDWFVLYGVGYRLLWSLLPSSPIPFPRLVYIKFRSLAFTTTLWN